MNILKDIKKVSLNEDGCLDKIMASYGKIAEEISIEEIETMDDTAVEQQAPDTVAETATTKEK